LGEGNGAGHTSNIVEEADTGVSGQKGTKRSEQDFELLPKTTDQGNANETVANGEAT
jgi:hypothetical protein